MRSNALKRATGAIQSGRACRNGGRDLSAVILSSNRNYKGGR